MFSRKNDVSKMLMGVLITVLSGCSPANDNGEAVAVGQVEMNLVGQAPSGNVYRLRDAVVRVTGPEASIVFDTESDPNRSSLSAMVPPGVYASALDAGWRLERLQPSGAQSVEAELLSPNPDQFSVIQDQNTQVALRFRAGEDVVVIEQGSFEITLDVQEAASPLAPCAASEGGISRDCGWFMASGLDGASCEPGTQVVVGCGCGQGGACQSDPVLRVCEGQGACVAASALVGVDDACSLCPEATFVCPESGVYSVMVGALLSWTSFVCEPVATP